VSFITSASRMVITDTDGTEVFDTDDRLFTVTDGPLTDSVTIGPYTATRGPGTANNPISLSRTLSTLASINASANTVRGAFKVTTSSAYGVANLGWFNASGSYVHLLQPRNPSSFPLGNVGLPSLAVYSFIASGGSLLINEQVQLQSDPPISPATSTSLTMAALTIEYHLFAGAWV
jgi:hypothetical protein